MKKTSISITDAEHTVLTELANKNNITLGTLLRMAAIKVASNLGAPRRTEGSIPVSIDLWPMDTAALQEYQTANEHNNKSDAVRAAMRIGLVERGFLHLPAGSEPDLGVRK